MKITTTKILSLPATILILSITAGFASAQSPGLQNFRNLIRIDPFSLDVVSPSSGVQFYHDGIVFLSDTRNEARMLENHTSFGKIDAYYAVPLDTVTGTRRPFSTTLSWQVPTEAMTFNYDYTVMYLDDNTLLNGVTVFPSATVFRISATGIETKKKYWEIDAGIKKPRYDIDTCSEQAHRIFNKAITCRLSVPGEKCLSLSGGLDSRTIAVTLIDGSRILAKDIAATDRAVSGINCINPRADLWI